jgi:hypothetical protein
MRSRIRLSVAFALLVAVSAWPVPPVRCAQVDKDLPDSIETVLVVDVRQIYESTIVKKYVREQLQPALRDNPGSKPLLSFLDPDTLKDIVRITVALPRGTFEKKGVIIVKGRFDLAKIQAAAEALSQSTLITLKIHPNDKTPLYEILLDEPGTSFGFSAFLDKETLIASPSRDIVLDAIARRAGTKPASRLSPDLAALIDRMERKQAIWVAGKVPDQWKNHLGKMPQFKPFAPKMQSFSGGIRLTEDIKASLHLQMSDVQAAVDIRQTLELSKLLVSVVIANDTKLKDFAPLLADILNALKFTQDKGTVTVEVTIEDSQIEKAFKSQP